MHAFDRYVIARDIRIDEPIIIPYERINYICYFVCDNRSIVVLHLDHLHKISVYVFTTGLQLEKRFFVTLNNKYVYLSYAHVVCFFFQLKIYILGPLFVYFRVIHFKVGRRQSRGKCIEVLSLFSPAH